MGIHAHVTVSLSDTNDLLGVIQGHEGFPKRPVLISQEFGIWYVTLDLTVKQNNWEMMIDNVNGHDGYFL